MKSSKDGAKSNKKDTAEDFKKFMEQQNVSSINDMLANNADRLLSFSNYRQIYKHIPECAQALDTYKDNIMSPDDFTKMVFNVTFNGDPSDSKKNDIDDQLESIMRKYKIVDKADRIIGETLLLGEQYVAVLSMEEDMQRILQDPAMQNKNVGSYGTFLNESSYRTLDKEYYSYNLSESDIILTEEEKVVLNEVYGDDVLLEDTIAKIVNTNI
jgi:hypothetical protein